MPSETTRILNLPTKSPYPSDLIPRLTALLKAPSGGQVLWQNQAEILYELLTQRRVDKSRGVFARSGVGTGKTLPGLLASTVLPPPSPDRKALYLCPAALRDKTLKEMPAYRRDWKIRADLLVHSYEEVSSDPELLTRLRAYLVICDECQAIRRKSSARTRRVLRTAAKDPSIVWLMMSATSSTKGIADHGHLFDLPLRNGSPLPRDHHDLESWGRCTDAAVSAEGSDWGLMRPVVEAWYEHAQEMARVNAETSKDEAYAREEKDFASRPFHDAWDSTAALRVQACRRALDARIAATPGVVTGSRVDVDAKLILRSVVFPLPVEIQTALTSFATTGEIPGSGGAKVIGERDKVRSESALCMGGYYRWAWEKTSAGAPDFDWIARRKDWSSALSEYLVPTGQGDREGIDTPGQVVLHMSKMPKYVQDAWRGWEPVRDRYRIQYLGDSPSSVGESIPVEPVWLTYDIIDRMVEELKRHKTILWYKHKFVAHELRKRGVRVVLSGEPLPWDDIHGDGRSVALSEFSHCEGLNLQAWHRMTVTCPGSAKNSPGAQLEQMLGRVYRSGQQADIVSVDFWQHADPLKTSLQTAMREARYIQDSSGIPQRLCLGEWK